MMQVLIILIGFNFLGIWLYIDIMQGSDNVSHLLANRVTGGANGVTSATGKSMKMATDDTEGNSDSYGNALQFITVMA